MSSTNEDLNDLVFASELFKKVKETASEPCSPEHLLERKKC
jgi:hypothetical protein